MKVNGRMTKWKVREHTPGLMGISMKEGGRMEKAWKKHGEGTILFKDGSKLKGDFRDDSPWKTTLSD